MTSGFLPVGSGHEIYFTTQGNKDGPVCLFLHGGPGIGTQDKDNRFFDGTRQFVIRYDQRGCGNSRSVQPFEENTTAHHVEDILRLLDHLEIDKVHLVGGSWGSTLAMLFTIENPDRVQSCVLRGYFSADRSSIRYFMSGCNGLRATAFQEFMQPVPSTYLQNPAEYYAQALINPGNPLRETLAARWIRYVMSCARSEELITAENLAPHSDAVRAAALQAMYASRFFFIPDRYIIDQVNRIGNTPITLVHGKKDVICPISYAEELAQTHPSVSLIQIDAAHAPDEPGLEDAMCAYVQSIK